MMEKRSFHLLGLSGSLRRAAASTAILRTVADRMPADVTMTLMSLREIPPYDEDEDRPAALAAVEGLKGAIAAADGLVVISPEYNHGISGVLKNAIDWVSRPGYESVLKNKPVLVMSSAESPLGGARAQLQLRELFAATLSRVVARRQICVGSTGTKIRNGELVDPAALAFIDDGIADLLDEIALLSQRDRIRPRGSLMRSPDSVRYTGNGKTNALGQTPEAHEGAKTP
jgi:chromate reductase, NAD(P)H dehydrogenase (quinone)